MKTYLRILQYAESLRAFAFPYFILSLLASLFGILNFTLLIPLLDVLFDKVQIADFQKFSQKTNTSLVGLDNKDSGIQTIKIEINETFKNYCLLSSGWGLLRNIANRMGIDIDHPVKASKVGNPFEG